MSKKGKNFRKFFKRSKKQLVGIAFSITAFVSILGVSCKNLFEQNKFSKIFESTDDELEEVVIIAEDIPEELRRQSEEQVEPLEETEDYIEEEVEYLRESTELSEMGYQVGNPSWDEYQDINDDYTAWLKVMGTDIDLMVVQGEDDDYYLHHNFYGEESDQGTLFLDYRNNSFEYDMEELSDVTFIFGHNMRGNGTMFAPLSNFKSQAYVDKYPYAVLYGENGDVYKVDFFAGNIVDTKTEDIYTPDFLSEREFDYYIQDLIDRSTFETSVDVQYGDKILGLVTCGGNYAGGTERFILYGVMTKQKDLEVKPSEKSLGLR